MRWIASFAVLVIVIGVGGTLYQSVSLPPAMSDVLGVSYPTAILAATLIFALLHAVSILRGRVVVGAQIDPRDSDTKGMIRFAVALGLWLAYIAALPHLGFIVASVLVVSLSLALLGRIGPIKSFLAGTLFVLVFNALFRYVLYVSTPQGPLDVWVDTFVYSIIG